MRVTAKGEYASQAALHLALQYPEVVTIQEIASRHHIPLKYLEQILLELKRGGVLESRRGVKGGYTLARTPAKISVGEVLRVVGYVGGCAGGGGEDTVCYFAGGCSEEDVVGAGGESGYGEIRRVEER